MYDIQGALRRRALKERLEALAQSDDPSVGEDAAGTTGSEVAGRPAPLPGAPFPPGDFSAGDFSAGDFPPGGRTGPTWPDAPADPGGPGDANGAYDPFPGRHRTDLRGEERRGPTFPQSSAGGGPTQPPSPYMTPVQPPASYPATSYPPASYPSAAAPPYALAPGLPEPGPVDLPRDQVIDNTLRGGAAAGPAAPGLTPPVGPAAPVTSVAGATLPPGALVGGVPGATVQVTVVPGTPFAAKRVPGRSGGARPGDLGPARLASPPAPPAPAAPAAPPDDQVRPLAPPAAVAPPDAATPAELAALPPTVGTAASAIADLLRMGGTSLFFRGDGAEPDEEE